MTKTDPKNSTRYWAPHGMRGLSLMHADFTTHSFSPHTHDGFVVAVTEKGGSEIKSRGDIAQADRGGLFVFNPEEPHAGWMGRSHHWRYRGFYLTKPAMAHLTTELGLSELPYFLENRFPNDDLVDDFLAAHRCLDGPFDPMAGRQMFVESFAALFSRHGSGRRPVASEWQDARRIAVLKEIIHARYGEVLTLDDLAQPVDLTVYQLIRLFKRTLGLPPHAYLTQVRLGAACSLLKRGLNIAESAALCGFYDQSALTNHFKRSYALTPLQFSRAYIS